MKKEDRDSNSGDNHAGDDHPAIGYEGSKKGGSILSRVALYTGVFVVLVTAVGGYYYLNYTRTSLNRRISGNPSGLVRAIDVGAGKNTPTSGEVPFIEGRADETAQTPRPSSPNEPVREVSPPGTGTGARVASGTPSVREAPTPPGTIPSPAEKGGRDGVPSKPSALPDQPDTLLDQLVLRNDNPFREKFLKRFQETKAPKTPLKEKGLSARSGRLSCSSRSGLTSGRSPILPDIADGGDHLGDLRVMGVIQTRETSIALTNRGELKVGSAVDGDAVTSITINEVRLKSGKTLKVAAQ